MKRKRRKGKRVETDTYRFALQLPLRGGDDTLNVNGCELTTTRADGTVVYRNAYLTNHPIGAQTPCLGRGPAGTLEDREREQ